MSFRLRGLFWHDQTQTHDAGGNGRGCAVAEAWWIKQAGADKRRFYNQLPSGASAARRRNFATASS